MSIKLFCKKCKNKFWDNVTTEKESNMLCCTCDPEWNKSIKVEETTEDYDNEVVDL